MQKWRMNFSNFWLVRLLLTCQKRKLQFSPHTRLRTRSPLTTSHGVYQPVLTH